MADHDQICEGGGHGCETVDPLDKIQIIIVVLLPAEHLKVHGTRARKSNEH